MFSSQIQNQKDGKSRLKMPQSFPLTLCLRMCNDFVQNGFEPMQSVNVFHPCIQLIVFLFYFNFHQEQICA